MPRQKYFLKFEFSSPSKNCKLMYPAGIDSVHGTVQSILYYSIHILYVHCYYSLYSILVPWRVRIGPSSCRDGCSAQPARRSALRLTVRPHLDSYKDINWVEIINTDLLGVCKTGFAEGFRHHLDRISSYTDMNIRRKLWVFEVNS